MARPKASKNDNFVNPESRKLFLVHVDAYARQKEKVDKATNGMRTLAKTIKGDGFSVRQIKDAIWLSTPEGEAEFKAEMANRMLAAAYVGADIGEQLSLFLDVSRTPAIDRAAKEGQEAAMKNKALEPPYDPSTDQYHAFVDAYHEEQGRQVKAGIGKLDAKAAAANKAGKGGKGKKATKAAKPAPTGKKRGRPAKAASEPAKGTETRLITKAEKDAKAAARAPKADRPPRRPAAQPVTRASLRQQQEAARENADSYFSKSTEPAGNA